MKKVVLLLLVFSVAVYGSVYTETTGAAASTTIPPQKVFEVYVDQSSQNNHYILSGWMGDYGDVKLNDQFMQDSHSGSSCIEFV
jgi:hypothetical protein